MDPLHVCIALGPVAVYLLLLGVINLSKRPFITSGARDVAALGVAIAGFAVAGPLELFVPESAVQRFGGFVWIILLALYSLCLTLWVLLMRPRLIIYNVTIDQLRPVVASVVAELDKDARWAGDSLVLPELGVQLHLESFGVLRNAQLVSAGPRQSYIGWRRLENALADALRRTGTHPNPYGFFLVSFGLLMAGMIAFWMIAGRATVAQALDEMLRW